jgi:prepilin-type processing-associated H-X9-DG protein
VINEPSETITFGEKSADSRHVHMDFYQGNGDDLEQLEHSRHSSSAQGRGGGSNFAFADGSARFLPYGGSVFPVNLWAVTPEWRIGIDLNNQ